jgi:DNA gyrase subunit A
VIDIIRRSQTVETARTNLMKKLKITEIQAQAILDMQLRRLASLERKKIVDEHKEKLKLIKYLEGLLKSPQKMREVIREELGTIRAAYDDSRRTIIVDGTASSATTQDLFLPEERTWVALTVTGKIARTMSDAPPKVSTSTKEPPRFILESTTTHTLYLFTADGQCATIPAQQLNQAEDYDQGTPFTDLCPLDSSAEIVSVLSLPPVEHGFLVFATATGQVKRLRMSDLPGMRSNAFTVINVGDDDRLVRVLTTSGNDQIILTTNEAQAIRFKELDVRPTGLPAGGMRGIKLGSQRGRVVGANLADDDAYVWTITDDGIAKISACSEYPTQGRAGGGVIAMRLPKSSQGVAASAVGKANDMIIVLSNKGKPKYMSIGVAEDVKRGRAGGKDVFSMTRKNEVVEAVVEYQTLYEAVEEPIPEE